MSRDQPLRFDMNVSHSRMFIFLEVHVPNYAWFNEGKTITPPVIPWAWWQKAELDYARMRAREMLDWLTATTDDGWENEE